LIDQLKRVEDSDEDAMFVKVSGFFVGLGIRIDTGMQCMVSGATFPSTFIVTLGM
jgi:hypothetical protein